MAWLRPTARFGPAIAPLHEGLALKEHFFGFRLDLENLGYGEADDE